MNHHRKMAPLASALVLAFYGTATSAQGVELEEIIVTAQKRSESVQDIPSTVNVIDGDVLRDFNALMFHDLEALTAGLQIDSLSGRSGRMSLRGISHTPVSAAEAAVTTYWNEAVVDSNAIYQQMFDIARMEVLRGPQGTLAGRTSPAGAINIHTAKPNIDEIEGEVRGTFTDNDGVNTQLAASFPLIPGKLAVRVAGVYNESDLDEIENDVTGDISHDETTAGRFSLRWLPTDSLSVDLAVQYLERDFDDLGVMDGIPTGSVKLDPEGVLQPLDVYDRREARVGVNGVLDNTDAEFWNSSLVVEWELESHTITSVTGYHKSDSLNMSDESRGSSNPENVARRDAVDDRTDWSQELRIASDGSDTWDYMVGAYYEDSDILYSQENYLIPAAINVAPFGAYGSTKLEFPITAKRWGLFTHNQFYLTDDWTLQVGLRYQEIDQERDLLVVAGADGFSPPFLPDALPRDYVLAQVISEDNKNYEDESVTGQLTLQYAMSDDVNLYGLVATGWRPGGITVGGTVLPEDLLIFDSEDSISYELGFKSTLMGGAMNLNGALFYQDIDDYISRTGALNLRDASGQINRGGITTNGDAEVWGAELEMNANLSENWYLGGALSYTNAEYADGTVGPCNEFDENGAAVIPEGQSIVLCDISGDPIGRAPDWSASLNSEYRIPVGSNEAYIRGLCSYTGEQYTGDLGYLDTYNTLDAFVGIRGESWNVELFARNLFDEEAIITGSTATAQVRGEPTGYAPLFPIPSRRVGLSASYRW